MPIRNEGGIEALRHALLGEHKGEKLAAIRALKAGGASAEAIRALAVVLTDNELDVRDAAFEALRGFGSAGLLLLPKILQDLFEGSLDDRTFFRHVVSIAAHSPVAPNLLIEVLHSPNENERYVAAHLLQGAPRDLRELEVALRCIAAETDAEVQEALTLWCARAGRTRLVTAIVNLAQVRGELERTATLLSKLGGVGEEIAIQLASGPVALVRECSARSMDLRGAKATRRIVPTLRALATDSEASVRSAAIRAFSGAQVSEASTVDALTRALGDAEISVRVPALEGLARLGRAASSAISRLVTVIENGSELEQDLAGEALASIGEGAVAPLFALMNSPSAKVRRGTMNALLKAGSSSAARVAEIVSHLSDADSLVRERAMLLLGVLGSYAAPALSRLEKVACGSEIRDASIAKEVAAHIRSQLSVSSTADNLGAARDASGAAALRVPPTTRAEPSRGPSRGAARRRRAGGGRQLSRQTGDPVDNGQALRPAAQLTAADEPPIEEAVRSADRRTRLRAAERLRASDEADAFRLLATLLHDPAPDVRRAACFAIGQRRGWANIPDHELSRLLDDEDPSVRRSAAVALASPERGAVDILATKLSSPRPGTRVAAATGLRWLGPRGAAAVPELTQCLSDRFEDVQIEAARSLAAIGPLAVSAHPALEAALNCASARLAAAITRALEAVRFRPSG